MRVLFILLFIPILGLGQNGKKLFSKKHEIAELQKTSDSLNRLLIFEIESLSKSNQTQTNQLEIIDLKQETLNIANVHLRKAKRKVIAGNVVTIFMASTAVAGFLVVGPFNSSIFDLTEVGLIGAGVLTLIGQFINVPLKDSAKKDIQKARELIGKINSPSNQHESLRLDP
jgi:hypothetical protein